MGLSLSWRRGYARCLILLLALVLPLAACDQQSGGTTAEVTTAAVSTDAPMAGDTTAAQSPARTETSEGVASPEATAPPVVASPTPALPSPTPTTAPTLEPTPNAGQFANPVVLSNFPDPDVIKVNDSYYAYATGDPGANLNLQVATSKDLVQWQQLVDPLPELPPWANKGKTWAPEVIALNGGKSYVMYFTAHDKASDKQCVGVATSAKPEGPFTSTADKPLVCQVDLGGTIDASPFQDGDKLYLYFKNDGNCCGFETNLYAQELSPDGLIVVGEAVKLARNDAGWEGLIVEAPEMIKRDDKYYLFFSGNKYDSVDYAVGYASCQSPKGPCQDAQENPILKTVSDPEPVIGPGHQSITTIGDQTWILYHVWDILPGQFEFKNRVVYIDRLDWEDGKPVVRGPTTSPQPRP